MIADTGSSATSCLARSALRYAARGWAVLPVRPRGKQPLTRHGVKDATADLDAVRGWWARWPRANVALAILEGYLVTDLDSPDARHRLKAEDLVLPATARANTGRGQHLWYSTGRTAVRNRVGIFPGVDIRAPGGYVIVPPSVHPNGTVYRWDVELEPSNIAECPDWLFDLLVKAPAPRGRSADEWHRKIAATVPIGRRNQTLAEVSGLFFRRLPAKIAAEAAFCWAQVKLSPPLPEREVQRTIDSIAGRELRRRGGGA